jgi:hypothetical protein
VQAQQDRADAHQDMNRARRDAAVGNYGAAAQAQRERITIGSGLSTSSTAPTAAAAAA